VTLEEKYQIASEELNTLRDTYAAIGKKIDKAYKLVQKLELELNKVYPDFELGV